ncbi:MAG: riboflavin synthase [Candidatus Cloacimonetes bacterium HGW-Cloacimonetes-2]|jgi:riboflavin synthase|nr:MAG: riboflavin synthase [Candidatus Cloacimonetes bacterium HGW-Cloacimonetes-2]
MFTGIIEALEPLISRRNQADSMLFTIKRPSGFTDIKVGSSIACNGICLTVLSFDTSAFTVQVMNETVKKSTAGMWKEGDQINLERALRLGDRLDGHWLQGHIDTTSKVLSISKIKDAVYLKLELPSDGKPLVVTQGSIAINGVSLTIAELSSSSLSVALIGHTLENTNLAKLTNSDRINLEYDVLGKYILQMKGKQAITKEWLFEKGF